MGHESVKGGMIQWKEMHNRADALLKRLNAEFSSQALMSSLSVAQQQMVDCKGVLDGSAHHHYGRTGRR